MTSRLKGLFFCLIALSAIFLFSPKVILATPTLNITEVPDSATIEESFSVEVVIISLEPKEKYFIKAIGGENWYDVKTWSDKTDEWLAWNGAWDEMPETIALDDGTSISTISAKFVDETTLGENQFKVKIVKWDETSKPFYSNVVVINVLPAPTPTPEPEEDSEEEPESPTSTPTPTPTPALILTPTPTKKPTPTPTLTPTPTGEILGEEATPAAEEATPTPMVLGEKTSNPVKFIPFVFIGLGGLLLLVSGGFILSPKLKMKYNHLRKSGEGEKII